VGKLPSEHSVSTPVAKNGRHLIGIGTDPTFGTAQSPRAAKPASLRLRDYPKMTFIIWKFLPEVVGAPIK
jgi:hypothetical protein